MQFLGGIFSSSFLGSPCDEKKLVQIFIIGLLEGVSDYGLFSFGALISFPKNVLSSSGVLKKCGGGKGRIRRWEWGWVWEVRDKKPNSYEQNSIIKKSL